MFRTEDEVLLLSQGAVSCVECFDRRIDGRSTAHQGERSQHGIHILQYATLASAERRQAKMRETLLQAAQITMTQSQIMSEVLRRASERRGLCER